MSFTRYLELNFNVAKGPVNGLVQSATDLTPAPTQVLIARDTFKLRIRLLQPAANVNEAPTALELDGGAEIAFGGRLFDDFIAGELLFNAVAFTLVSVGDDRYYEATLNLNTAEVIAALAADKTVKVRIDVEAQNAANTERYTFQFDADLRLDAFRGDEGDPVEGDPQYPLPSALLTTDADSLAIKRGNKAIAIADETLAIAFATAFALAPTTVIAGPIVKTNPGDADPPIVLAVYSITAAGFSVKLSAAAPAAASLPWLAIK